MDQSLWNLLLTVQDGSGGGGGGGAEIVCDFFWATHVTKVFATYNLFPCFSHLYSIKVLPFRDCFLSTFLAKAETNRLVVAIAALVQEF